MSEPAPAQATLSDAPALLRHGLLLLWLFSAPVLAVLYLKTEPSPDQAQFDYMAWLATQGHAFYSGSFDMNWPGAMLLQEAAIRLFGPQPWAWHMVDFLLMQMATIAAALFLWRAGFRLAPWIALALYPPIYVTAGGWMAGQRDIVAMNLLIMACCAMLAPARRERAGLVLAGALVAGAVLIRPTYLSVLAGLLILEALPRGWIAQPRGHGLAARAAALAAGFGLIILAVLLWAVAVGNLDDWYQQSVLFTSQVYYHKPPMDMVQTLVVLFTRWWHWLSLCGAVGLVLWLMRDRGQRYPLLLVIGLAAAILLSYVAQNKGFGYHIAGFLPLLVMLGAVALDQLDARRRLSRAPGRRRFLGLAIAAMAGLVVLGSGTKLAKSLPLLADYLAHGLAPSGGNYDIPAADQARIVEIIRSETGPQERMVQYGTAYHVPYLAQRLPAHRFITPAIELMTPDFTLYKPWMAEITLGLQQSHPKFILITGAPFTSSMNGLAPVSDRTPVLAALLAYMGDDYVVRLQDAYGTLFERAAP